MLAYNRPPTHFCAWCRRIRQEGIKTQEYFPSKFGERARKGGAAEQEVRNSKVYNNRGPYWVGRPAQVYLGPALPNMVAVSEQHNLRRP